MKVNKYIIDEKLRLNDNLNFFILIVCMINFFSIDNKFEFICLNLIIKK